MHPGTEAILGDLLVRLFELPRERLVREIVHLRELREPVDGDDDVCAEVARVLAANEVAGVVRDDVEAHRH